MIFIAEIGLNHNGNFDLACEMIRQAKLSGADIAKFQLGWRDKQGEINCIDSGVLDKLFDWANFVGIELMFSTITRESFELVKNRPLNRYKIASRTVRDDKEFVQKVVDSGKQTIISLGMWDGQWLPSGGSVKYLWCKSEYPAYPKSMIDMPKKFDGSLYEGYSDHTIGIDCALLAISRGAKIIEKHFTLDKSDRTIRDHVPSATPDEFRKMVEIGRGISKCVDAGV